MRRALVPLLALAALAFASASPAAASGVVASWPVGHQPFSVAVDPTDGRVYVSDSGTPTSSNTGLVSVVDPASGLMTTLTTSGTSDIVAIDAAARRLYSSNANVTLDVFDLATGSRITTLPVGGLGVAVDPATHRVYAAQASSVAMIDGTTNTVLATRAAPPAETWFAVVLDPDLHRVYISNVDQTRPTLIVLDDRDLSLIAELTFPQPIRWAIAVDRSTHTVYVAGSDPSGPPYPRSTLYVLDPTSLSVTPTTVLGGYLIGLVLTASTQRIYVLDGSGNRVIELDEPTLAVTQTIALPWGPALAAMHPDGRLYVAAYQGPGADVLAAVSVDSGAPVIDSVTLDPATPRTNDVLHATVVAHDRRPGPYDPPRIAYEWSRNGVLIAGANASFLDLSASGFGDRGDTITVRVTANDGLQTSVPKSTSVVVLDSAPTAALTLDNTSPTTNTTLLATATGSDVDRDALSYTFTWKVNGLVRRTTSGPNVSDSFDLSVAGDGDRGDTITATVTASDGQLGSTATASVAVANSAPTASLTLDSTAPTTNAVVTATAAGTDPDGDALGYTFTWKVNGIVRRTTSGPNTSDGFDLRLAGNGDRGDTIMATVTVSDGQLSSTASASVPVADSAPSATVAFAQTSPMTNAVVNATAAAADPDGDALSYTFTWMVNGLVRRTTSGPNLSDSFDLAIAGNGDRGDTITATVTASDGQLGSTASASVVVADSAPRVSLMLDSTAPTTNAVVSAIASGADDDGDVLSLTFTWKVNGLVRRTTSGPNTSDRFDLGVAGNGDRGDTLAVTVTVSDGQLSSSASSSVVILDSAPTASVTLDRTAPATNTVVSATAAGSDPDGDALSYTFTWMVNGLVRRTTSGPTTSDSFDLGIAGNGDHGDTLVVEVVAADGTLASGVASASATVVNSPPTVAVALNTTTPATRTVLVATASGQDIDRDALTFTYTWRLNGVVRRTTTTAATTDSYDLSVKGNGGNGDVISVSIVASDASVSSSSATATAIVTAGRR